MSLSPSRWQAPPEKSVLAPSLCEGAAAGEAHSEFRCHIVVGFEPLETAAPPSPPGGIKGKRKSKKDELRERSDSSEPKSHS